MTVASYRLTFPALLMTERQRWTAFYENHLQEQLAQSINHVHRHPPAKLIRHLGSLLTLLRQARLRPELDSLAVELIAALHPWPLRWAYWEAWERELGFAARVFANLNQTDRQAEFLGYLADILFNTGRLDKALAVGERAITLARASDAVLPLSVAGCAVVSTLVAKGHSSDAACLLEDLLKQVARTQTASLHDRTVAMARLGLLQLPFLRYADRSEKAVANASQIITSLESMSDTDQHLVAEAYRERSTMQWSRFHYTEAVQDIQRAIQMFAEQGDLFAEADARGNLGLVYWTMTELNLAEENTRHVIGMAERLNARWHLTYALKNLGLIYLSSGELDQALHCFERAETLATSLGDTKEMRSATGNRAIVKLYRGKYEVALQTIEADLEFAKEQQILRCPLLAVNYILLSLCHAGLGRQDIALQLSEQALDVAQQIGSTPLQTLALRGLAEHRPLPQRTDLLHQALTLARQCWRRLDEAACLLSLAGLAENKNEQADLWNQGVQLLKEIGATAWLKDHSPQHPPRIVILM